MPSINQSSSLLTCMRPLVRLEVARLGVPLGAVGKVATVHPLPRQLLLPLQLLSMLHAPQLPRRSLQRPEVPRLRRALLLLMEPHDGLRRESDQLDDGRLCVLHGGGGDGGGRGRRLLPPDDVDLAGRALGLVLHEYLGSTLLFSRDMETHATLSSVMVPCLLMYATAAVAALEEIRNFDGFVLK